MTANSLYPACVKIEYSSDSGQHVMTLPTVPVVEDETMDSGFAFFTSVGTPDTFDVHAAVLAMVNKLKPVFHTTTSFVAYTVFTFASPEAAGVPVYTNTLAISGTNTAPPWRIATQWTFTFRCTDFTLFKLVLLDIPTDGFDRESSLGSSGWRVDLMAELSGDDSVWRSRGGGKVKTFLQVAKTLNEKLRRAYHLN